MNNICNSELIVNEIADAVIKYAQEHAQDGCCLVWWKDVYMCTGISLRCFCEHFGEVDDALFERDEVVKHEVDEEYYEFYVWLKA